MSAFIPSVPLPFRPPILPPQLHSRPPHRPFRTPHNHPQPAHHHTPTCATSPPSDTPDPSKVPFEIRGFSLANVGLLLGGTITLYSFSTYFGSNATASATSLGFVYGVPILLIGCALKYAELEPIRVTTTPQSRIAFAACATETQKKLYSDITRHRYGDEAHLAPALASLGLVPRGEPCPELVEGEESVGERGEYCLRLIFRSVATPWDSWKGKIDRYERFFGPGVRVEVVKVDSEKRLVAMTISSLAGSGVEAVGAAGEVEG